MNNYHIDRCESLINNASVSRELRMVAESLVAIASGVDDADSMARQALERIEITLGRVNSLEQRLGELEKRTAPGDAESSRS